ncbi:MAG: helix-turn-helix transcriptional regulator [Thermomicrobiales bacterium]
MNRTDRLTGIILALQSGRRTAGQLAERFEVSRRTILRDIDALCEIGVPVVSLPGAGGGLELHGDHWLKPVQLTQTEAAALLLAARGLGSHPDAPLSSAVQSAVDKLRGVMRPEIVTAAERELAMIEVEAPRHPRRLQHFARVKDAIARQRWLRIEYQSLRRVAVHTILPESLVEREGFWHCNAISLDARQRRQFRLDRMLTVDVIATPPTAEEASAAANVRRPPYDDPSHPEVVIALTYTGARLGDDLPRLEGRICQIGPDRWELRFRCPPSEWPYYARTFLGFGPEMEIVVPVDLRRLVHDLASATATKHDGEGDPTVSPSGC